MGNGAFVFGFSFPFGVATPIHQRLLVFFFLYFLSIFYYTFTHDTPPLWNGTRLLKVDSVFCFPLLRFFFGSGRDVCGLPHKRHRSAKKLKKIGSPCNESFTITQKEMSKEIESKVAC